MKRFLSSCILFFLFFAILHGQNVPTRIAIIGCHNQHHPAPTFEYLVDEVQPAYCIWVGDNVYADTQTDPNYIKQQLEILASKEGFQKLREQSEFLVTWDDHDYGLNNAGISYIFKEESKQIHRTFWDLEEVVSKDQDGVYYARIEQLENDKKIQFILLDGRYNKTPRGKKGDALGEQQWKWLENQLAVDADLRFIVSGYQILLNKPSRWEIWAKQGNSKKRLFDLIKNKEAKGIVFITGDQHYAEVLKRKEMLPYDAFEIMAAGINKNERPGWASCRVAGPDVTINSAPLITVHWQEVNNLPPHIEFKVIDVDTKKESLFYRIFFSEIGL